MSHKAQEHEALLAYEYLCCDWWYSPQRDSCWYLFSGFVLLWLHSVNRISSAFHKTSQVRICPTFLGFLKMVINWQLNWRMFAVPKGSNSITKHLQSSFIFINLSSSLKQLSVSHAQCFRPSPTHLTSNCFCNEVSGFVIHVLCARLIKDLTHRYFLCLVSLPVSCKCALRSNLPLCLCVTSLWEKQNFSPRTCMFG